MFSSPKINDWKPGVHDLYAAILFPVKHALICATTMLKAFFFVQRYTKYQNMYRTNKERESLFLFFFLNKNSPSIPY